MASALIYFQEARISPDAAFSVMDWTAYVLFIVVIGGVASVEGPSSACWSFSFFGNDVAPRSRLSDSPRRGRHRGYRVLPEGLWGSLAERFDLHVFRCGGIIWTIEPPATPASAQAHISTSLWEG